MGREEIITQKAIAFLQENYFRDISAKSVSSTLGYSYAHLWGVFKRTTGETPQDYLTRLRIDRSKTLLGETDLTVARIATDVGYRSPIAFNKAFNKNAGTSPSAYRKAALASGIVTEEELAQCVTATPTMAAQIRNPADGHAPKGIDEGEAKVTPLKLAKGVKLNWG